MSWEILKTKATKKRTAFLRLLTRDLHRIRFPARLTKSSNNLIFRFRPSVVSLDSLTFLRRLRRITLWRERDDVIRLEKRVHPLLTFASVDALNVTRIQPQLKICRSKEELALFDYLRRYQTTPSNPCVGATLKAIVYDVGQSGGEKLLGIIALTSAQYFQGARDQYLGWENPAKGRKAKRLRETGLKRCLHVATCMAVPPYDTLRCARLVALMCFSTELQRAFEERYGYSYLALTAGASMREYSVVYDRLHMRALVDAPSKPHLYSKLRGGTDTYRYLTSAMSAETISAGRLLAARSSTRSRSRKQDQLNVIRRAMRACGIPFEILRTNRTATYFGAISTECIESLRTGRIHREAPTLELSRILSYWNSRFSEGGARSLQMSSRVTPILLSNALRGSFDLDGLI